MGRGGALGGGEAGQRGGGPDGRGVEEEERDARAAGGRGLRRLLWLGGRGGGGLAAAAGALVCGVEEPACACKGAARLPEEGVRKGVDAIAEACVSRVVEGAIRQVEVVEEAPDVCVPRAGVLDFSD